MIKEATGSQNPSSNRVKSPQHPYSTLKDALEDAEKIYEQDKTLTIPQEAAAKHLGYAGLNGGLAARRLSTLKQYGLAEFPQSGKIRLTQLFSRIKYAADSREKQTSMLEALSSPAIFKELFQNYEGVENLPSDQSLKSMLIIEKNFNSDFVDKFIKTMRESVRFYIEQFGSGTSADDEVEPPKAGESNLSISNNEMGFNKNGGFSTAQSQPHPTFNWNAATIPPVNDGASVGYDQISIRLPGERKVLLYLPQQFFEEDKEFIRRQLEVIYSEPRPASANEFSESNEEMCLAKTS